MGFRSAWALLSVSAGLGFIVGCATQASDSPIGGNGGETSSSAGTGGALGTSGSAGSNAAAGSSGLAGQGNGGGSSAGSGGTPSAGAAGTLGVAGSAGSAGGANGGAGAGGHGGSGGTSGAGGGGGAPAGTAGGGAGGVAAGGAGAGGGGASGVAGAGGNGGVVGKTFTLNHAVVGSTVVTATVNVTWSATKIEFVFTVQDATPFDDSVINWQDDASEIYLDLNNGKSNTFQSDDCEIVIPRATGTVDGVGLSATQYAAISVQRTSVGATGYILDVSVPWTALNIATPPLGQTIGINLAVDDDSDGGDRNGQLMLSGNDQAYDNPSTWASLLLN